METTTIRSLYESIPTCERANTNVSGWVRTMRESKAFAFVELNDGSYFRNLQVDYPYTLRQE